MGGVDHKEYIVSARPTNNKWQHDDELLNDLRTLVSRWIAYFIDPPFATGAPLCACHSLFQHMCMRMLQNARCLPTSVLAIAMTLVFQL